MRAHNAFIALTVLAGLASCTRFGATASDELPTDSGSPSSSVDASVAPDATTTTRFCEDQAPPYLFCDDFDDLGREPASMGWVNLSLVGPSRLTLATSPSPASPLSRGAVHVQIDSQQGISKEAKIERKLAQKTPFNHLEMRFRLLVVNVTLQFARLPTLWMVGQSSFEAESVSIYAGSTLDGDEDGQDPRFPLTNTSSRWHDCVVAYESTSSGYRARTTVDGVVVKDVVETIADGLDIYVFFGAFNTSDSDDGTLDVWLDDVVVRGD